MTDTSAIVEYIQCAGCRRRSGLALGAGKLVSEQLPDPFQFKCPSCGHEAALSRMSIRSFSLAKTSRQPRYKNV